MDKRLILAVAGSGKTTKIIESLDTKKHSLVITYTNNNFQNLKERIVRKFGYFPNNIVLWTYFSFLYKFCYRPLLSYKFKAKGINYEKHPNRYVKQFKIVDGKRQINGDYFVDNNNRLYSNRIAKLLELQSEFNTINSRLSKYFDNLFVDEVQDFAGHDFNLLRNLSQADIEMMFVGDFYQHTFDTSRDGNVNKSLHKDYDFYVASFVKMGMSIDKESLKNSHRCSPSVCAFIRDNLNIEIHSNRDDDTQIIVVDTQEQADEIFRNEQIVKLFYRQHYEYGCYSRNWGDCKGEDKYNDVCVVLNQKTVNLFQKHRPVELKPQARNKLYVACSRARGNLYLVPESFYKKYKRVKNAG